MSKVALVARILLGLIFFVFGLNGFLDFLPPPEVAEGAPQAYMGGLAATGYFFPVLKLTELVSGAMLLTGLWVPLALILLSPIVVQIALFHFLLDPAGTVMAIVLVALQIFVAWTYRDSFRGVLERSAKPT